MTRTPKYDWELLKREYIFDPGNPPISYTALAERHGMLTSRSQLTDRAAKEGWTKQREEFRVTLGIRTIEAMSDKIAEFQVATRERMMTVGLQYMDQYAKALEAGEIKVSTRDMIGVAAMLRTLIGDQLDNAPGREGLIDPDAIELSPAEIQRHLALLEAGEDDRADEDDAPAEPAEAARPN